MNAFTPELNPSRTDVTDRRPQPPHRHPERAPNRESQGYVWFASTPSALMPTVLGRCPHGPAKSVRSRTTRAPASNQGQGEDEDRQHGIEGTRRDLPCTGISAAFRASPCSTIWSTKFWRMNEIPMVGSRASSLVTQRRSAVPLDRPVDQTITGIVTTSAPRRSTPGRRP